jgi:hypothetical protein
MCNQRENCFHFTNLKGTPRIRELINQGKLIVQGNESGYCDAKTPLFEGLIPPDGMDISCAGPGKESCPGPLFKN